MINMKPTATDLGSLDDALMILRREHVGFVNVAMGKVRSECPSAQTVKLVEQRRRPRSGTAMS